MVLLEPGRSLPRAALLQGAYYVVTGLWPLVHMPSFEALTGKKVDGWLVKTVGALIAVVGASLMVSPTPASRRDLVLGVGSAVALGSADTIYSLRGRIPPVYLLDAVLEAALVALWLVDSSEVSAHRATGSARTKDEAED